MKGASEQAKWIGAWQGDTWFEAALRLLRSYLACVTDNFYVEIADFLMDSVRVRAGEAIKG